VEALAQSINNVTVFQGDLSQPDGCETLLAEMANWAPAGIDRFVHGAGDVADAPVVSMAEADWDITLGAHLSAPWRLLQGGLMALGGSVVLIGSGAGRFGRSGQAAYAAAKCGMGAMAEALAPELARGGVRINTVVPGPVDTAMWRALDVHAQSAVLANNALERINTADEVASFIRVVLHMSATSGQVLSIGSRLPGPL
jgi:NAD(P)-dependent dehydrogenase (short-subunit alcohol dehydrogenase family)